MKKITVLLMLLGAFVTQAQSTQEYLDAIKSSVNIDVKSFVYDGLNLSDDELNAFDPLFNRYLDDDGELGMEKMVLFEKYAKRTSTLSNEQFNDLNLDLLKNELSQAKVNKKYYKKFVKVLGLEKTTSFFFITRYIDNAVQSAKLDFLSQ